MIRSVMRVAVRALLVALGAASALAWVAVPASPAARVGTLVVRVVDLASREPIPNAQVTDLDAAIQYLTNARGEARLERGDRYAVRVRVRQLGYRFVERTLPVSAAAADTATFALERAPFVLPVQRATAIDRCDMRTDAATQELSLLALSQLRLAAEHYDAFRRTYPFTVRSERKTVTFHRRTGAPARPIVLRERTSSSRWGDPYRPGRVLRRERLSFSASLLFVLALADTAFWDRHCLVARNVESHADQRWLRLDFAPARDLDSPDWSGSAWLDSATSVLRRIEFRMTGLGEHDTPRRLEGYTTFSAPSPFITIPDSTLAYWWRGAPASEDQWGTPDVLQVIHVTVIEYDDAKPPP